MNMIENKKRINRRNAELGEYHQEQWPMLKVSILVRVL